jgi:hypothetical protein
VEAEPLGDPLALSGRRDTMRLRKMVYAMASLAALAMAIGAGWKPG